MTHRLSKIGINKELAESPGGRLNVTRRNHPARSTGADYLSGLAVFRANKDNGPARRKDPIDFARNDKSLRSRLLRDKMDVARREAVRQALQRLRRVEGHAFGSLFLTEFLKRGQAVPFPHKKHTEVQVLLKMGRRFDKGRQVVPQPQIAGIHDRGLPVEVPPFTSL
jgi:hypothetical protein